MGGGKEGGTEGGMGGREGGWEEGREGVCVRDGGSENGSCTQLQVSKYGKLAGVIPVVSVWSVCT